MHHFHPDHLSRLRVKSVVDVRITGRRVTTGLSYTCSKQQSTVPARRRDTVLPPPPRSQTGSQHQRKIGVDRRHAPTKPALRAAIRREIHARFATPRRWAPPAPFPTKEVRIKPGTVQPTNKQAEVVSRLVRRSLSHATFHVLRRTATPWLRDYTAELVRVADIQLAARHVPRRLRPQSIPWPYTRGMPPNLARRRRRRIRPMNDPPCSVTV